MKPATLRKRAAAMAARWQRDLDALERMFPRTDWSGGDEATEVMRNLATAVAWCNSFGAMSDEGIRHSLEHHAA